MKRLVVCLSIICLALSVPLTAGADSAGGNGRYLGMFDLYQQNRDQGIPNYITEDFLILAHSMIIDRALARLEKESLSPLFTSLVRGLADRLAAAPLDEIGRANRRYLAVLGELLDGPSAAGQAAGDDAVAGELGLIMAAEGIALSPVTGGRIDYSQFKPRGNYAGDETLERYFRAVRYAGTVLFPVQATAATGTTPARADLLTGQALQLARLMATYPELAKLKTRLDSLLTLMFGPSEELHSADYISAAGRHPGDMAGLRRELLTLARKENRRPRIISMVVDADSLEPGVTVRDAVTGWRLLPSRFTPDAAAFQKLVFDSVTDYRGKDDPFSLTVINGRRIKGFPLGLELMALLGSATASSKLAASGETDYAGYSRAFASAAGLLPGGTTDLTAESLAAMTGWLSGAGNGLVDPARRLNTCLGWWTRLRHTTVLYTKQSYTVNAKSLPRRRATAWLTPAPRLYHRLAQQASRLHGLTSDKALADWAAILGRCRKIAGTTAYGQLPAGGDVDFLNGLDRTLLRLTGGRDKPIVTDVHTEPGSGQVLQEGLGWPRVVERKNGKTGFRGALFSYYEFKQPMSDRLTDGQWQSLVSDSRAIGRLDLSPGSTVRMNR